VTYTLNPVYKNNIIVIEEHPFLLSRSVFGRFVVSVQVQFKPWTDLDPILINHLLDFKSEKGKVYERVPTIYVNQQDED
jgi:transcription initiation factor IIF auxiliary subunit